MGLFYAASSYSQLKGIWKGLQGKNCRGKVARVKCHTLRIPFLLVTLYHASMLTEIVNEVKFLLFFSLSLSTTIQDACMHACVSKYYSAQEQTLVLPPFCWKEEEHMNFSLFFSFLQVYYLKLRTFPDRRIPPVAGTSHISADDDGLGEYACISGERRGKKETCVGKHNNDRRGHNSITILSSFAVRLQ